MSGNKSASMMSLASEEGIVDNGGSDVNVIGRSSSDSSLAKKMQETLTGGSSEDSSRSSEDSSNLDMEKDQEDSNMNISNVRDLDRVYYDEDELSKARTELSSTMENLFDRFTRLRQQVRLYPISGDNMWEGNFGMMTHVTEGFPMPQSKRSSSSHLVFDPAELVETPKQHSSASHLVFDPTELEETKQGMISDMRENFPTPQSTSSSKSQVFDSEELVETPKQGMMNRKRKNLRTPPSKSSSGSDLVSDPFEIIEQQVSKRGKNKKKKKKKKNSAQNLPQVTSNSKETAIFLSD